MAKNDIDKAFTKLTGLTYSITDVINNCESTEEKEKLAKKLNWVVKNGIIRTSDDFIDQSKGFTKALSNDSTMAEFATTLKEIADFDDIYEASIDDVKYSTLQEAVNAATEGCTIKLLLNTTLDTRVDANVDATYTIDLDGHKLIPTVTCSNGSAMRIFAGTVTLQNGTIDGSAIDGITNTQADPYGKEVDLVDVKPAKDTTATLNVVNITAKVNSATGCCFYAWSSSKVGTAVINIISGTFTNTAPTPDKSGFVDMLLNQGDTAIQCIFVKGGVFYGSDPKLGDNAKKCTSFMADEYTTISNTDGSWKVIPIPNTGVLDPEYNYNN